MSSLRLLLLGGSGRLGSALRRATPPTWTILSPGREQLNLANASVFDLQHWIKATAPNVVLNSAAMAGVDDCEKEPEAAMQINSLAPGRLGQACGLEVVPLLHISTDYVFGDPSSGSSPPFAEDCEPCPVQLYGRSKAMGESAVLEAPGRAAVVRVSWLTDPGEGAFARFLLSQVRAGAEQVAVLRHQRTRPTMTGSLSRWLFGLAEHMAVGNEVPPILHPAGCDPVTRGEWAEQLLEHHGYAHLPVVDDPRQHRCPDHAVQAETHVALRPRDSSLDVGRTMRWSQQHRLPELEDWRHCLAAVGA